MDIKPGDFRVSESTGITLGKWPTRIKPLYKSKEDYASMQGELSRRLSDLEHLQYASSRHALLVVFQAMDAAGKDSTIRGVLSGVNPQGCQVYSFKQPSAEELRHDFLWRACRCLPERGRIGVFNRSYYEEVLVVRVHPELLDKQGLPEELTERKLIWKDRFRSIVDFERHLVNNGTQIVKIFLHVSKDEQLKRLLERIDDPDKNWKFSPADIEERRRWKDYMKAYGECIGHTSTKDAPWFIVPADDKRNARLIVSEIIIRNLEKLKMNYPEANPERRRELKAIRKGLAG